VSGFEHKPCYHIWEICFWGVFSVWVHIAPTLVHGRGCTGSRRLSHGAEPPASPVAMLLPTGPQTFLSIFGPARGTADRRNLSITRWHMWAVLWL